MSAAIADRYLKPARDRMQIKGISTTKPSPLLRNSITIRTCTGEAPQALGVIEADTVAHCGPTLIGEFARTSTMTDLVTGWIENHSIRNTGNCGYNGVSDINDPCRQAQARCVETKIRSTVISTVPKSPAGLAQFFVKAADDGSDDSARCVLACHRHGFRGHAGHHTHFVALQCV